MFGQFGANVFTIGCFNWKGILISDNYGVYVNWVNKRQTCLAHLIRKAKGLAERKNESIRNFGECILKELQLLCHWAKKPPDEKQWTDFYSRLLLLLMLQALMTKPASLPVLSVKELSHYGFFLMKMV